VSWRKDFDDLWDQSATIKRWVALIAIVGLGYAFWVNYEHDIKSFAIGVLILAARLVDETTWYFWVILIGGFLWMGANRKNRQRQEMTIKLLTEIRDKLNTR